MSLYTAVRHPRTHPRRRRHPPQIADTHVGFNGSRTGGNQKSHWAISPAT